MHKERNEELYNFKSGKNFTQYLLNEVIPFIDSTYSSSGFNAMIGHSNGAEYNHILMLNQGNPIRGFISLSTSFITSENSREELPDFFKNYEGKNMCYFIGNATLDPPDRVEYGNVFESLYQNTPNPFIKFVKQTL